VELPSTTIHSREVCSRIERMVWGKSAAALNVDVMMEILREAVSISCDAHRAAC
jgi:hypothetical protein